MTISILITKKKIGEFGGETNLFKFKEHINKGDVVLDFGCGGGYLLENINCKEKIGIDINPKAREKAREKGIKTFSAIGKIGDNKVDKIISNHALEHVKNPLQIIQQLKPKLKSGGKAIFVVPHEKPNDHYDKDDINNHLYTWNPQTLGNLFKEAGFEINSVSNLRHKWPPHYIAIKKYFGKRGFNVLSTLYAIVKRSYQIKIVAKRVIKH